MYSCIFYNAFFIHKPKRENEFILNFSFGFKLIKFLFNDHIFKESPVIIYSQEKFSLIEEIEKYIKTNINDKFTNDLFRLAKENELLNFGLPVVPQKDDKYEKTF